MEEDVPPVVYRSAAPNTRDNGRFTVLVSPPVRFWSKVDRSPRPGGCWLWTDGLNRYGYGRFAPTSDTRVMAHRWAYEEQVGPIPPGLTLDHLCERTDCVNPDHLEPVTNSENLRRRHARRRLRNGATR